LTSNLRLDHPRRVVCGAIWQVPMKIADRSRSLREPRHLRPFCYLTLARSPSYRITLEIDRKCKNELPTSRLSKVIVCHAYIHTYRHDQNSRVVNKVYNYVCCNFYFHRYIWLTIEISIVMWPTEVITRRGVQ